MSEYRDQQWENEQAVINEMGEGTNDLNADASADYPDTYDESGEYPIVQDDIGVGENHAGDDSYEQVEDDCDAMSRMRAGVDNPREEEYLKDENEIQEHLGDFAPDNWENMSDEEREMAVTEYQLYQADLLGLDPPPTVEFYDNPEDGDYGGYSESDNTIHINRYMMDDSAELVDTISHESRHAYQHMRAENPQNERDREFAEGFENYISPEDDFEAYEDQLVESDARDYGEKFKEYVRNMK